MPMPVRLAAVLLLAIGAVRAVAAPPAAPSAPAACPAFLDHEFQRLHSAQTTNPCREFAGRPLLIVNTASHCGYTPQFKGLQALHATYAPRGLVVLGFPSDDFHQEAADAAETAQVCYLNYGVKFTMFATSPVTGAGANPVFRELARQSKAPDWNFTKYLVTADGRVVGRFPSAVEPDAPELRSAIEALLARK